MGAGIPAPTGGVVALPVVNVAGESTEEQSVEASIEKQVMAALAALATLS